MSRRREFEIPFVGLRPGTHEYNYEIGDKFFDAFQQQDFRQCNAKIKLFLTKENGFMLLKFEVGGSLEVTCDRCSSDLPFNLWDEFTLTIKVVESPELMNEQEEDPFVFYISRSESHIDVANWIFEFINLSLPMQKACGFEKMDGPYCNKKALELLTNLKVEKPSTENPIWKGLEKFKDME